ncbi:unnamed protein product [Cyclocybe aegerita]|uniref:F-box domain-containing protein n=1 Tax=Cyclocybe aegerita TaxID=1973307 RepID=A0A8S0XNP7_CYCAE|nr:unnamed protein product [Cyclocybe aegerita]
MAHAQVLPIPVLLRIFDLCMKAQDPFPAPKDDVLRVITHAFPEWRRVALACPSLWTHIQLPPVRFHHPNNLVQLFQQSVERSSGLPVTVELYDDVGALLPGGRTAKSVEDFLYGGGGISIIDTILQPIRRCLVSLTCLLCGSDIINFLRLPSDTFPALECVSITFIHTLDTPRSPFTQDLLECLNFTVFESHGALKEAKFDILNGISPLDLKLPWAQLTKLDMNRNPISPLLFLRLMRRASSSLVEGSFHVEFPRISQRPFYPRYFDVLMPRLTTLHLKLVNPSLDTSFFFYIRLPRLQALRIEQYDDYAAWELSMFDPFLMHFRNTLRILELADFSPSATDYAPPVRKRTRALHQELESVFAILWRLEDLRLPSSIQVHAMTIEKLADGRLLPSLTELELFAVNAEQILWMKQRRKFLSRCYQLQPGSSRMANEIGSRISVKEFRHMRVWVKEHEVERMREAAEALGLGRTLSIAGFRL